VGQWDLAENRVKNLRRSPYGLRQVLLSAAASRRGDLTVISDFAGGNPKAEEHLSKSVQMLLDASLAVQGP
ncbi:hypothetical protein, partial [Pseudomonas sp. FW215-R2]|uniref:hypothetical protein n=1 Tax=Pseudomonas sp. FW215-R2 TaxID=2070615 RepID=UPI001C46BBAB